MHILIATDTWYPTTNGVVRVIDSVRLRLFERGHRVTVVTDQFLDHVVTIDSGQTAPVPPARPRTLETAGE